MSRLEIASQTHQLSRRSFLRLGATGLAMNAFVPLQKTLRARPTDRTTPRSNSDEDWAAIRREFITKSGVAFLNNASIGMPPAVVMKSVAEGYKAMASDPINAKVDFNNHIQQIVLPKLASILGAHVTELVLTRNASEALHLAATGLVLEPGDEILITTQEHPSGRRPWRYRAARHGIAVTEVFVPSPIMREDIVLEQIVKHITPRTRALAFCHVTRGGHLYPVSRIVTLARERGLITIVDGAQAIGTMPVNLHELGCDAYAASLHKWMLGPMGTGMLYVREDSRKHFLSVYAEDSTPTQPNYEPTGTVDLPLRAALDSALSFIDGIGLRAIELRDRHLSNYLKSRLSQMLTVKILSGPDNRTSAPGSTIFEINGVDAVNAVKVLAEKSLHVDEHQRDGHNAIRISTHFYNTMEEIDRTVEALKKL